ncbi:TIGR04338 family metallohydrolase [Gordonia otitidis]|uniref:TIGR04338 family metallohydrolase n=1 Tax=Gordonia otitidis TaxID=249058 RepID=UPI001D154F86|nr:TIGR04338 family metallohydrolase [Gordonia otitidis]UEA60657.1 TIGR04338 family metallohydrolase [Gordonia otitidis]
MTATTLLDVGRARLYAAEDMALRLFDHGGTVQLAGAELTLPPEARFASVDSVDDYVRRVLAMPTVAQSWPRASVTVRVRPRRGHRKAHYEPDTHVIAVPDSPSGRWALRELVVLHEIAHHLDDSSGAGHGPGFARTLIELVGLVLGPEAGLVYRVIFADGGVA